ncbi:MAG: hypothetical protein IKL46_04800 [Clostridia bacterium]|nr:hypothetical protein [Clostridia bacterium]
MAKNEAKIKFTAETGKFNDAIKKSNDELSKLRAETKLNETQMKNTGTSVEGLQQKQKLLGDQLKSSQDKTEALNQKLNKAVEIFGENSTEVTKLQRQLANARNDEEKLKLAISNVNTELQQFENEAKQAESATSQLTNRIDEQQTELTKLKGDYVEAVLKFGDTSDEAQKLAREIGDLSSELKNSKNDFQGAIDKADKLDKSLDDVGDAAADTEGGFSIAKGAVADLASEAIQMAISKVSEFISYLRELPEATRELRQDMATLDTSFEKAGFTTEQAKNTWKELYTVFGEDDRAVEAANLIAKMSDNQEDLNSWVTITQGIWGTYQDSLPVEGLAEASNETAKVGQVTGVLADALNWSSEAASMFSKYMGEDVTTAEDAFNEALKECTTEEERQALITETLTALYGDAATKYEEASGSQIAAKEAAAENTLAQNDLANAIEPVTTKFQELKNESTQGLVPAVEKVSAVMLDAMAWMEEHPVLMKTIGAVIGVVAVALGTLTAVVIAYTVAQWAMNSAILANPITWVIVGIVAAIAAVVAIIVLVIEYWDKIVAAVQSAVEKVKSAWNTFVTWIDTNVIQPVKQFFTDVVNAIKTKVTSIFNSVKNTVSNVFNSIKSKATSVWNGIKNAITKPVEEAKNKVKGFIDAIKGFFSGLKLKLPHIKMPHFSIKGKFSLDPPSVPKLAIDWYAKGGIMTRPTIFGFNGTRLMGGGEAGHEAILPIEKLKTYMSEVVEDRMNVVNLQAVADAIDNLANRPNYFRINDREFALATASAGDSVNGFRTSLKLRGLEIE